MHSETKTRRQKLRSKASEYREKSRFTETKQSKRQIDRTTGSPSFSQEAPWGRDFVCVVITVPQMLTAVSDTQ